MKKPKMKYSLGQKVIVNDVIATIDNYDLAHEEYTVKFSDGTKCFGVKENDIKPA